MNIVTYEEKIAEVIKCDWCHNDVERKQTRCWVTGSRLCPKCYKDAEDKWNKFLEEFRDDIQGTFGNNTRW